MFDKFLKFKNNIQNEGFKETIKLSKRYITNYLFQKIYFDYYYNLKSKLLSSVILEPYEIVFVPVKAINYSITPSSLNEFNYINLINNKNFSFIRKNRFNKRIAGQILKGDWDLYRNKFNDEIAYLSFKQRFIEGKEWEDTYYKKYHNNLMQYRGFSRRNSKSWEEFKNKCLIEWDKLYKNIKDNGYKTQEQLKKVNHNKTTSKGNKQEIEVAISRNGEILFVDGRHRLSIAKILELDSIPVIVNVWHKAYIEKIKLNYNYNKLTPKLAIQYIINNYENK